MILTVVLSLKIFFFLDLWFQLDTQAWALFVGHWTQWACEKSFVTEWKSKRMLIAIWWNARLLNSNTKLLSRLDLYRENQVEVIRKVNLRGLVWWCKSETLPGSKRESKPRVVNQTLWSGGAYRESVYRQYIVAGYCMHKLLMTNG